MTFRSLLPHRANAGQVARHPSPSIAWATLLAVVLGTCSISVAEAQSPEATASITGSSTGSFEARGVVKAIHQAVISSENGLPIAEVAVAEGDRFEADAVLIRFNCARTRAELAAAEAARKAAAVDVNAQVLLKKHGAGGSHAVNQAQAQLERSKADVSAIAVRVSSCIIKSPFAGRVVERVAHPAETPGPNQPLLRIINDAQLELDIVVPSPWLRWLKVGQELDYRVDETGTVLSASVISLGAQVDPVSQTIRIKARPKSIDPSILPGMSGTARFKPAA
jgi:membrane fusion protein, multidrug efflux system